MLFLRLETTLHKKMSCSMLSYFSWDNIALVKTLPNVVQEPPDNIAQEKSMCSVVLILLWQHCTGKILRNVVLETPGNIAEDKKPVQCCRNTPGTTLVKNLCNVAQETPDNIAQEKTQCNVVRRMFIWHCLLISFPSK